MNRKYLLTLAMLVCLFTYATEPVYILDMSDDEIVYNENDVWEGVYNEENLCVDGYVFSHTTPYGYGYYEGFIASRNTDSENHYDAVGWTNNQWGCMAKGGVDLASGETFDADAVVGKPFIVSYYSAYSLSQSEYGTSYITLDNNGLFKPQGLYVCNSPWGYYGCTVGDGFAQPLVDEGGYYKVTFHGVNMTNQTTEKVDFYLAQRGYSDINSDGVINSADDFTLDHWAWCDLSQLGEVNLLYITMDSSDKGEYGMNTSTIVCLDGLQVKGVTGGIGRVDNAGNHIYFADGNLHLALSEAQQVAIFNLSGTQVLKSDFNAGIHMLCLSHLPHGIYFVKHNAGCERVLIK